MAVLRVREPFAVDVGGVQRVYRAGDLVSSADPVVTPGRTSLFEPVEETVARSLPPVEQATAAPGERRSVRPRRSRSVSTDSPAGSEK